MNNFGARLRRDGWLLSTAKVTLIYQLVTAVMVLRPGRYEKLDHKFAMSFLLQDFVISIINTVLWAWVYKLNKIRRSDAITVAIFLSVTAVIVVLRCVPMLSR